VTEPFQRYADRAAAGAALAEPLADYARRPDVVVLGLPRGGVVVAAPIADRLGAPLGVLVVRKLGVPGRAELAMGVIAAIGDEVEVFRNDYVVARAGVDDADFDRVRERETRELRRRRQVWGTGGAALEVTDRTVIVVDDGLATGSTMHAAVAALRRRRPREIVVAVPIAAPEVVVGLATEVDRVVCPWTPQRFHAVGQAYGDFSEVSDAEVARLLS
jgi:putative phosphoribosyl transferase